MTYVKAADREGQLVAAARRVMSRSGVAGTTLRAVAAEADVALGTLHYVMPTKEALLRAVISQLIEEIAGALRSQPYEGDGLENALRHGITGAWRRMVAGELGDQIMQYELTLHALRAEELSGLAQWQYDRYAGALTEWCEHAARGAGERCAVGFDSLGRIILASIDGLVLQYLASPDPERAERDLGHVLDMIVLLADPQPVTRHRGRQRS